MPIPKPNAGEEEDKFIGRCMSAMKEEFTDNKQRLAVCYDSWRKAKKLAEFAEEKFDCECIKCGFILKTVVHCKDIKCPECGGQMRRKSRPGPGQELMEEYEEIIVELKRREGE